MGTITYTISYKELKKQCTLRKAKSYYQCDFCYKEIKPNEIYYDRGSGRRIHKKCLDEKLNIKEHKCTKDYMELCSDCDDSENCSEYHSLNREYEEKDKKGD